MTPAVRFDARRCRALRGGWVRRLLGPVLLAAVAGTATAGDLLRGERLYTAWCLDCHGPAREPTQVTSLNARHSVPVLREGIANARSGMLFLGDVLSAQDLSDIVAFLGTTPTSVDFGTVPADADPAAVTRSVELRAGRDGFTDLTVAVQGDFTRTGGSCGRALGPDQACRIELAFRPQGPGERQGVLLITHGGLASTARVPLVAVAGTATSGRPTAVLALDTDRVDFGSQTVGQRSAARTVVASNRGDAPLAWLSRIPPAGFTVDDDCGDTLAPGAQCRLALRFAPLSAGAAGGELVLVTSHVGGTVRLPLAGVGVAAAARLRWDPASPPAVFPATPVGRGTTLDGLGLRNDGPGPVRIESIRIAGAQAGEFVVADAAGCRAGLSLDAGAGCALPVVFTPRGVGERRATLSVVASGESPAEIALAGAGLDAAAPPASTNVGGGGCTIGGDRPVTDPLWLVMTAGALAVLWRRRRRAAATVVQDPPGVAR